MVIVSSFVDLVFFSVMGRFFGIVFFIIDEGLGEVDIVNEIDRRFIILLIEVEGMKVLVEKEEVKVSGIILINFF